MVEVDQYSRAMIGFCELLSAADQLSAASISIGINEYDLLSNGSKCREQFLSFFVRVLQQSNWMVDAEDGVFVEPQTEHLLDLRPAEQPLSA